MTRSNTRTCAVDRRTKAERVTDGAPRRVVSTWTRGRACAGSALRTRRNRGAGGRTARRFHPSAHRRVRTGNGSESSDPRGAPQHSRPGDPSRGDSRPPPSARLRERLEFRAPWAWPFGPPIRPCAALRRTGSPASGRPPVGRIHHAVVRRRTPVLVRRRVRRLRCLRAWVGDSSGAEAAGANATVACGTALDHELCVCGITC